jgi:DNA modification methylase
MRETQVFKSGCGKLIFGDNLEVLKNIIPSECINLCYLDPPFGTQASYGLRSKKGEEVQEAYSDIWSWSESTQLLYEDILKNKISSSYLLAGMVSSLGKSALSAYLVNMLVRLRELHRVLKPTGSLYLHCSPISSHYLKSLLDTIFNIRNFRNEIAWKRNKTSSYVSRSYRQSHDIILFYTRSDSSTFNAEYKDLSDNSKEMYRFEDEGGKYQLVSLMASGKRNGKSGEPWRSIDPNNQGKSGMHWVRVPETLDQMEQEGLIVWPQKEGGIPRMKKYLHETQGVALGDIWDDIDLISATSNESVGYPTQKPEALLERIIRISSNEDDIVLDPFCGSGTTLAVAQQLGRKWLGIDNSEGAVTKCRERLNLV